MPSPAFLHRQKHAAIRAAGRTAQSPALSDEERILHRLYQDEKRLKGIQSNKRKAELKREMLPDYQGWIDGTLAADSGRPDKVVVMCATWMIDAGCAEEAMPLIEYIVRHKLPLPDDWNRTQAAFFVEEICNPALMAVKLDTAARPLPASMLLRLNEVTAEEDMPDAVRAKLFKLLGLTLRHGDADMQQKALDYLVQAMTLNDGAGVKKEIDTLRRAIARSEQTSVQADGPTDNAPPAPPASEGENKKQDE